MLEQRIEQEPRTFIQVIAGPRQVGKTTLVTQFSKRTTLPVHFVSADSVIGDEQTWIRQQWERGRHLSRSSEAILIIDEVQKLFNWSEHVKREWDEDTRNGVPLKVILLGSSRLLLQAGLTESLAGRFELSYLGHWSYREMKIAFDWTADQYVWFGGYPGSAPLIQDPIRWRSYIQDSLIETSISKDILMMSRVNKPALLRRLFELGAGFSGQIFSYTKILGQLQDAGNTTTLSHYLSLLHQAGMLAGLEKYSGNVIRQRASSPRFQVHNNAFLTVSRDEYLYHAREERSLWGRMVESAVGAHLLNQSVQSGDRLFYWREKNQEIDFVYERRGSILAIEVKAGTGTPGPGYARFLDLYPEAKALLVGDQGIPWPEFLETDIGDFFS